MTKKEDAIGWFTILREKFTGTKYGEYLDIAIKALEQEWILDKLEEKIDSLIRETCDYYMADGTKEIIDKYKDERGSEGKE